MSVHLIFSHILLISFLIVFSSLSKFLSFPSLSFLFPYAFASFFYGTWSWCRSRDCSVGIATGYGLDDKRVR
jgi:hypothetical protein